MLANPNIIETVSDPRLGQVDLVAGPPPCDLCFIKRTQHNSPEEMQNELARLAVRRNIKDKRLLQVFEVREVGGLVSEVAYEFPSGADFQPNISQADKLFCFVELLEALASMQRLKTFHGDIRPDYVCYSQEEGRVVLVERLKERIAPLHLQLANIKKSRNLYLSGRIYDELMAKTSRMKHNSYKSDVFQLGMVFLELFAGETRVQKLYDRDRRVFDWSELYSILEQQKRDSRDKSIQSFFDFLRDFVLQKEEDKVATPIDALKVYYGFHRPAPTIVNPTSKLQTGAKDPETKLRTEGVKIERSKSEGGVIRLALDLRPFGKDKILDDALDEVVQYNITAKPSDRMGFETHVKNSGEKQKNPTASSNGNSKAKMSGLIGSESKSKDSATKSGSGVAKATPYLVGSSQKKQRDVDSNLTSLAKPRSTPFATPPKDGQLLGLKKPGRTATRGKVNKSLSKVFDNEVQNSTTSLSRGRPNLSVEKVVELQIPRQNSELAKPPRATCISPNMSYFNKRSVHAFPDKPQFIENPFPVSRETKNPNCPLFKPYTGNNLPLQNVDNEIEAQVSKRLPDKENVDLNNRTRSGTCRPVSSYSNPSSNKDRISRVQATVEELRGYEGRGSHPSVSQSVTSITSSLHDRPSQTPNSNERGSIIPASQVSGSNASVSYLSSHYLANGQSPMSQPLTSCTAMYQLSNLSTCHPPQKGLLIDITNQNLRPSQLNGISKPEPILFRNTQVPFTSNQPQNHLFPKPLLTPQYVSRAEAPFDSKPQPVYESLTPSSTFNLPYKSSQSDMVYSGSTRFLDAKWSPIKLEKLPRNLPKVQTSKASSDLELTF